MYKRQQPDIQKLLNDLKADLIVKRINSMKNNKMPFINDSWPTLLTTGIVEIKESNTYKKISNSIVGKKYSINLSPNKQKELKRVAPQSNGANNNKNKCFGVKKTAGNGECFYASVNAALQNGMEAKELKQMLSVLVKDGTLEKILEQNNMLNQDCKPLH